MRRNTGRTPTSSGNLHQTNTRSSFGGFGLEEDSQHFSGQPIPLSPRRRRATFATTGAAEYALPPTIRRRNSHLPQPGEQREELARLSALPPQTEIIPEFGEASLAPDVIPLRYKNPRGRRLSISSVDSAISTDGTASSSGGSENSDSYSISPDPEIAKFNKKFTTDLLLLRATEKRLWIKNTGNDYHEIHLFDRENGPTYQVVTSNSLGQKHKPISFTIDKNGLVKAKSGKHLESVQKLVDKTLAKQIADENKDFQTVYDTYCQEKTKNGTVYVRGMMFSGDVLDGDDNNFYGVTSDGNHYSFNCATDKKSGSLQQNDSGVFSTREKLTKFFNFKTKKEESKAAKWKVLEMHHRKEHLLGENLYEHNQQIKAYEPQNDSINGLFTESNKKFKIHSNGELTIDEGTRARDIEFFQANQKVKSHLDEANAKMAKRIRAEGINQFTRSDLDNSTTGNIVKNSDVCSIEYEGRKLAVKFEGDNKEKKVFGEITRDGNFKQIDYKTLKLKTLNVFGFERVKILAKEVEELKKAAKEMGVPEEYYEDDLGNFKYTEEKITVDCRNDGQIFEVATNKGDDNYREIKSVRGTTEPEGLFPKQVIRYNERLEQVEMQLKQAKLSLEDSINNTPKYKLKNLVDHSVKKVEAETPRYSAEEVVMRKLNNAMSRRENSVKLSTNREFSDLVKEGGHRYGEHYEQSRDNFTQETIERRKSDSLGLENLYSRLHSLYKSNQGLNDEIAEYAARGVTSKAKELQKLQTTEKGKRTISSQTALDDLKEDSNLGVKTLNFQRIEHTKFENIDFTTPENSIFKTTFVNCHFGDGCVINLKEVDAKYFRNCTFSKGFYDSLGEQAVKAYSGSLQRNESERTKFDTLSEEKKIDKINLLKEKAVSMFKDKFKIEETSFDANGISTSTSKNLPGLQTKSLKKPGTTLEPATEFRKLEPERTNTK